MMVMMTTSHKYSLVAERSSAGLFQLELGDLKFWVTQHNAKHSEKNRLAAEAGISKDQLSDRDINPILLNCVHWDLYVGVH